MDRNLIEAKAREMFGCIYEGNEAQLYRATIELRDELNAKKWAAEKAAFDAKFANWID
jgi:hypothetical protein